MKISRFFGVTNREAMRQVRLALGSDALIISNRRVEGGVEILATDAAEVPGLEEPPRSQAADPSFTQAASQPPSAPHQATAPLSAPGSASTGGAAVPPGRPPVPSPKSPLGAYAAAFQAAYGSEQGTPVPDAGSAPPVVAPTTAAPATAAPPTMTPKAATPPLPAAPASPAAATVAAAIPQRPSLSRGPVRSASPAGDGRTAGVQAAADLPPRANLSSTADLPPAAGSRPSDAQPEPDIMDAIGAMRGALETRIDELMWGNQLRRAPHAATLFQTLLEFGFSTALLRVMLKRLPGHLSSRAAFQWAREELVSHLPVLPSEDALWVPGLALALVGPTGVGKTTTIAKLAARCVRRFGPDKLVLITTDTYRIGAHEQLKIYGQMLRVPVHVVRNGHELHDIVAGLRDDQIILIDNVGISQRDRYVSEQAALLAAAGRHVSRLLVLNAASHGETLDEVARSYAADGGTPLKGCIISKVDEASRLGAALDTALRYRLPIHYVSTGQKVPEHLEFMTAAELVDRALTHPPSARILYAPTEADFAALMSLTRVSEPTDASADDSRRHQLAALPRLLSMTAEGAAHLSPDDLRAGCQYIDELGCASQAYELWRSLVSEDHRVSPPESWAQHMLRNVQNAWNESGHPSLLALHDQVALRAAGKTHGQLRATLVLDAHGAPVSTVMQQLSLPEGWLSSCGAAQPQPPVARQALLHQLDWLAVQAADLPLFHVFEGGNPALWRELVARELPWLAQVPAITRIYMEDGSTTVQALAKTLAYQPVTDPDYLCSMTELAGAPASERAMWVASTPVMISSRGQAPLPLHMVSVRLVDRASGKQVKQIIGLHASVNLSAEKLATWLVIKAEARDAMRHAAAAWFLLASRQSPAFSPRHQALVATQTGLAAWQLQNSPLAEQGRELAAIMLGRKRLPPAAVAAATLKLFALKEILEG